MSKTKILSILLVFCTLVILVLSLHIYKQRGSQQSVINLFGEDKYLIEDTQENLENYTRIYTLENKKDSGFRIFEDFMNSKGYFHLPDEQLGALHVFSNKNGDRASCDSDYVNRGYVVWNVYWRSKETKE